MIPRQVIEEILQRTNLHQLISRYVTLHRSGSNYLGLCPFHSEKTPSFTVFNGESSFYCFGCGVGGDAISFVKKIENLDYVEAVHFLAKDAGINIPEEADNRGYTPKVNRKRLYEANREAAKFFHATLFSSTPEAQEAYRYLHDKRGLSDATIRHFGLGFAPREYRSIYRYMTQKGFTIEELVYAGLCGQDPNTGNVYDCFYNRVMFPIIDVSGNVLGFGGRVMDDSLPKYRNTSETIIFNKRRNLYGLNFAKDSPSEELILCEGYMDVIAVQTAGFSNAVATLGTAITPEQARLMKRYAKRVIISYDMDRAGRNATEKAMRLLEEVGIEVKILEFNREDAKDPDEFIRVHGKDKFARLLGVGKSKFDYNLERILSKYDLDNPQNKIDATRELCNMIAEVPAAAERDIYITVVAKKLDINPDVLRTDVAKYRSKKQRDAKKRENQDAIQSSLGFSDKINPDYVRMPAVARCEEAVLGLLLLYPQYVEQVKSGAVDLKESHFLTEFNRRIFLSVINPDDVLDDLFQDYSIEETGRITKMKIDRMALGDNGQEVFDACVSKLKSAVQKQGDKAGEASLESINDLLAKIRKN